MKRRRISLFPVVLLAVALVLAVLVVMANRGDRGTATEAAPPWPWATTQFVEDSIEAFNQTVVQPIADTVRQLQGDVSDLDRRVRALETTVGQLQGDVSDLDRRVRALETTVGQLQGDVSDLDRRVTALETDVDSGLPSSLDGTRLNSSCSL